MNKIPLGFYMYISQYINILSSILGDYIVFNVINIIVSVFD